MLRSQISWNSHTSVGSLMHNLMSVYNECGRCNSCGRRKQSSIFWFHRAPRSSEEDEVSIRFSVLAWCFKQRERIYGVDAINLQNPMIRNSERKWYRSSLQFLDIARQVGAWEGWRRERAISGLQDAHATSTAKQTRMGTLRWRLARFAFADGEISTVGREEEGKMTTVPSLSGLTPFQRFSSLWPLLVIHC